MMRIIKNFLLCNFCFFLLQLLFISFQGHSFVSTLPLPKHVYWEIGFTLYLQAFAYVLLSLLQVIGYCALKCSWPQQSSKARQRILIISSWGALLCLNAYYFPLSQYSRIITLICPPTLLLVCGAISVSILMFALLLALFHFARDYPLPVAALALCFIGASNMPLSRNYNASQPDIIIIGVDSLSPTAITPQLTPTLWAFTHQNVWFEETISPLARTYPAWSTILSGLYPFHHKARYNLIGTDHAAEASIAWKMKQAHYTTLFATDDRRFNLLDESFGFEHIIGPRRGVNDMLMGTFNDFLLGNLLINTRIGRWFFPYNYMNRASYFSYYPETFDSALQQAIQSYRQEQPFFMAVHFTLPHWPYTYASTAHPAARQEYNIAEREPLYHEALHRVDQQVQTFLETLNKNDLLKNTLVIVLSDHGETLYTPHSRPILQKKYQGVGKSAFETYLTQQTSTVLDRSAGHGSDLLSPEQFHCVLAFQYYHEGKPKYSHERITARVGLQDIAPTLLDYIHQPALRLDGISLRSRIEKKIKLPQRAFILESGMLPNQFLSREKARLAGQHFFSVDKKTSLLHLRQDKLAELDQDKLYAILKGPWILALYPTKRGYLPILQDTHTEAWTDDLNSRFAYQSPAQALLKELRAFYKPMHFKNRRVL